jgi:hypothetical protein
MRSFFTATLKKKPFRDFTKGEIMLGYLSFQHKINGKWSLAPP